jgi:hypothetical protein
MRKNEKGKMLSKFLEKASGSLIAGGGFTFTLSVYRDSRGLKLINVKKEHLSQASDTEFHSAGIPLIANHTSQPSATDVSYTVTQKMTQSAKILDISREIVRKIFKHCDRQTSCALRTSCHELYNDLDLMEFELYEPFTYEDWEGLTRKNWQNG